MRYVTGEFSGGDTERFAPIVDNLVQSDYFLVAADFQAYLDAQDRVEAAFRDTDGWMRSAVLNTANLGWFSSDRSIRNYDEKIWHSLKT